ncbi:hypothetical protein G5V57_04235 [Nordella sp. HKS 07]|uniref:hypothetical protein n=1 Tax=Nordella sp. HKS 07 TaxID=2712222 RepID=UPI0013E192FD|nr:hypothetical protein [Nordella sp. HKS 07]QIG47025.1 hypothetical protein G5V57_04235 [Nordella sp. HKS 07]
MKPAIERRLDHMHNSLLDTNEHQLLNAVLAQVCRDLQVTDDATRSKLRDHILVLADHGVRDFETLRNYAARPRINRFSMVDPA